MIITFDPDRIRDRLDIDYHGGFFTHLDAICHVTYGGKIFNGHDMRETVTDAGCEHLGITGLKNGVVTKAVLIDVPRLRGVPYLEPGTRVYRQDIEEWEEQTGATVESGDVLLVRTGRWARRVAEPDSRGNAGMDASFLPLLAERDVALFGSDTAHELGGNIPGLQRDGDPQVRGGGARHEPVRQPRPGGGGGGRGRLNRWEFMFMAGPVRVPKGTGSPINPIAVF